MHVTEKGQHFKIVNPSPQIINSGLFKCDEIYLCDGIITFDTDANISNEIYVGDIWISHEFTEVM